MMTLLFQLYQVGAPASQPIAPVAYMWRPSFQQNMSTDLDCRNHYTSFGQHDIIDKSIKHDVGLCEKSDRMKCDSSSRHLWVWIHASAFAEEYNNVKLACKIEMEKRGISINCSSLECQLAKLELMGSGTFQLLQKILHPVRGISENNWQLKEHVALEADSVSHNRNSEKSNWGLELSQSALRLYFKEHSSGKWGMQIPDDSTARESHRWPIGFVTTASVQARGLQQRAFARQSYYLI